MLLAAGTLVVASCLRQNTWNPYSDPDDLGEGVPVPVQLYSSQPYSTVKVKGQGALQNWDGNQRIYVYAIARKGLNAAADQGKPLDFAKGILINNVKAYHNPVASSEDKQAIELYYREDTTPMELFYYDEDRRYEFFGYYVDEDTTATVSKPEPVMLADSSAITLPVTIDGSQDLMLAYAHKEDDNRTVGINVNRMYSAYSARKGIRPNLQFAHQLARFDVHVQSGDPTELAAKLTLAKVTVESHNKGTLYIANKDHYTNPPYLKVDESTSKPLDIWRVKNDTLCPLDTTHHFKLVQGTGDDMITPRLEAGKVMVMPGQQKYTLYIGMLQEGYEGGKKMVEYTTDIDFSHVVAAAGLEADTEAVAGHKYDIDVIVYGLQGVNVLVSMSEWQTAGEFIIDRDREVEINIPADNLVLDFTTLGASKAIGATAFPTVNLKYEGYNTDVIEVDESGTVTSKGWGTTYIFVNAPASGDYMASTRIVTVVVLPNNNLTVEPVPTLHVGQTCPLDVTQGDPSYHAPLTFTVENESIATIDAQGIITAKAAGTTKIDINAAAVKDKCRAAKGEVMVTVE